MSIEISKYCQPVELVYIYVCVCMCVYIACVYIQRVCVYMCIYVYNYIYISLSLSFFLAIKYISIGVMNNLFTHSFVYFQDSFQKILLALCKHASDMNNIYKKHRVLIIYHFFVSLLLKEIKDGLGGAWAFVLRDVIYTLIHHISSR